MFIFLISLLGKLIEDGRVRDIVMKSDDAEIKMNVKEEIESIELVKESLLANAKVIPAGFDIILDANEKDMLIKVVGKNILINYENEKFGVKIRSEIKINIVVGELQTVITNQISPGKTQTELQIRIKKAIK